MRQDMALLNALKLHRLDKPMAMDQQTKFGQATAGPARRSRLTGLNSLLGRSDRDAAI